MCEVIQGGFIDKFLQCLKKQINHQPAIVGKIHFGAVPAFFNNPGIPLILNAAGMTITIITQTCPGLTDLDNALDGLETGPDGVARFIIQNTVSLLRFLGLLNGSPDLSGLGSKKIYFLSLNSVISLFLANLAGKKPEKPITEFHSQLNDIIQKKDQLSLVNYRATREGFLN